MALKRELESNVGAIQPAGDMNVVDRRNGGALTLDSARRPIVVVLGMHRSGTSLCSHILSMLGVDMADEVGVNRGNDKGHWERWEIMALQDEILALLNRGYRTPQHDFPLPPAWWAEPGVRAVQTKIENFLSEKLKGKALFGFKDPRTARLLPMWLRIFKNLDLAPRFVLCLREPSQIARSLHERDGLDPAAGEYRALNYLADCFRYIPRHDLCIVNYEEWFGDYSNNLNGLMNFLAIEWEQSEVDLGAAVSAIVDPDLRHSEERLGVAKQPLVRSFYNLAVVSRKDPSRRGEIDHFVNQFVAFQQLLWPFERTQRELSGIAARVPELVGGVAELAAALEANSAASQQREQALGEAFAARGSELDAARAVQLASVERLAQSEARLAEREATLAANKAAGQQREQALGEALAVGVRELDAARAEQSAAAQRLAQSEARLAEREAALAANNAAGQQREQALGEALAAGVRELDATRAEQSAAAQRLAQSEARLAELQVALEANGTAAQLREQVLSEGLAERDRRLESVRAAFVELQRQEQSLRASNESAVGELEAARQDLSAINRREQELSQAKLSLESKLGVARAELLAATERLTEREVRLAELEAALEANDAASQLREQTLDEALTARGGELEAARAEQLGATQRLAQSEARLAEIEAALEANSAASQRREQALSDALTERGRELEGVREAFFELKRQEQWLRASNESTIGELEITRGDFSTLKQREHELSQANAKLESEAGDARAELMAATDRLAQGEARLAALETTLQADSVASQQREQALNETLAARSVELDVARVEQLAVAERLAQCEARLAELEAALEASNAASQQREQALNEMLAARGAEVDVARAEQTAAAERVAALEADSAAGQQRLGALTDSLVARSSELAATRAEQLVSTERLEASETRFAQLKTTFEANSAAGQQREQMLLEGLAERGRELESVREAYVELKLQERSLRASNESAIGELEIAREDLSALKQREQELSQANARLVSEAGVARTELFIATERLTRSEAIGAQLEATSGQGDNTLPLKSVSRRLERELVGSGLFDPEWYSSEYEDVAASGLSPISHFLKVGHLCGYRPNPLFDTRWYLERYDDVRRSGMNPLLHYILNGSREGRDPGPNFQTNFYLETNPDVRGSQMNPLAHYLRHGRHAGKLPAPPINAA
jgi:hypothetical protein